MHIYIYMIHIYTYFLNYSFYIDKDDCSELRQRIRNFK